MRKRSYGSVDVFWLDRTEAVRRIEEAAAEVVRDRAEVEEVHLFGSLAEGRAVPGSDADVLLVLSESDEPWVDRPAAYRDAFRDVGMPVELFCYTREEVDRHPLAGRAREEGRRLA